jgi:hypothetical protein
MDTRPFLIACSAAAFSSVMSNPVLMASICAPTAALAEPSREADQDEQHRDPMDAAHRDERAEHERERRQHDPAAVPIDQSADPQAEDGSRERRNEIHLRESHAIDREVAQQRFGDQSEALRPSGQRADQGERRDAEHHPP